MSFDPETGEWHDQVEHLLYLRRRPLSPVISVLPDLADGIRIHHQARHRAMELLGQAGTLSDDRITEALSTPVGRAFLWQAESELGCGLPPLSRPTPERLASDEIDPCAVGGDGAAPHGAPPHQSDVIPFSGNGFGSESEAASAAPEGVPEDSTPTNSPPTNIVVHKFGRPTESDPLEDPTHPDPPPTNPTPTNIVVDKFGPDRWRSHLPAGIPGLYGTMIGAGHLSRILAVMRDDGLLDGAVPGEGILLELEDEVIERYDGDDSDEDARLELRDFITYALPDLDSFFAGGLQLSPSQQEGCQRLAEGIHSRLSTRGSGNPITVDGISSLLRTLIIKSGFERREEWTLDHIAVRAGWAEDIGTEGVTRITDADRKRLSRFIARICQDYWRDTSGRIKPDQKPPVLALLRCERKGHQGVSSLYTFIWENWGEAFADLALTPCPEPWGDADSIEEMVADGLIVGRSE